MKMSYRIICSRSEANALVFWLFTSSAQCASLASPKKRDQNASSLGAPRLCLRIGSFRFFRFLGRASSLGASASPMRDRSERSLPLPRQRRRSAPKKRRAEEAERRSEEPKKPSEEASATEAKEGEGCSGEPKKQRAFSTRKQRM
uniref:Uncharacterized protein n=1 Tax=Pediastrum duplex TaxID=3105 RepID=A0A2U8GIN4_PEDDU|nr:hypothetical protein [Pediastrum duplex]